MPSLAFAKCGLDLYGFYGVVREVDGKVASGAYVEISYRDSVWYEPHMVETRADGMGYYKVVLKYYPYSGNTGEGDECDAVLKSVNVLVTYRSKSNQFVGKEVQGNTTNLNFRVNY
jgi:hypothetical protein